MPDRTLPALRLLGPQDAAPLLPALTALLHRAYAGLGAMGLNYTAVDQTPEVTAQRLQGGHCLVAEQQGVLVGTLLIKPTVHGGDCAYYQRIGIASVHQFAVDPALQGLGLGRTLLDAAEAWALARAYRELALDTAEPATHLVARYGRWGYRAVAQVQWPGKAYRSVVMSKVLG